jgi:hypothetical protein
MKKKYLILLLLILCIAIAAFWRWGDFIRRGAATVLKTEFIPNQNVNIEKTEAFQCADSTYKLWAKNFRFHKQGFFLASFSDSSRLVILAEPPNHVNVDSLLNIFSRFNIEVKLRNRRIGIDGYGRDIQIIIARSTKQNLKSILEKISIYFYETSYKVRFEPISANYGKIYYSKDNLNYFINLDELKTWFLDSNEQLEMPNGRGLTTTVSKLLKTKIPGVLFSKKPGFVVWALPKYKCLQDKTADIRRFTLDSDLILGAISSDSMLVIIGRERVSPLNELPPLRVETIRLLASITSKELSQSLDINDLLAGKMENGEDWCPTYLSPELENTELGELLTITDILLKDWSEHGTIRERYYNYPKPGHYPFRQPLFRMLGLNELVYNWNTVDVMYAIDLQLPLSLTDKGGELKNDSIKPSITTIYAIDRTGSLPVSYFNSQQSYLSIGYSYENTAYDYFSNTGNTDLARVVQYVALYQIFVDNGICYDSNTYAAIPRGKSSLLNKPVSALMNAVRALSNSDIQRIADSLGREQYNSYVREQMQKEMRQNEANNNFKYSEEHKKQIANEVYGNVVNRCAGSIHSIRGILEQLSAKDFELVCKFLAYPRGNRDVSTKVLRTSYQLLHYFRTLGNSFYKYVGIDVNTVKNSYIGALSGSAAKYIKSSSAVVTFNDLKTTGGHNISSRITRVNRLTNYRSGGKRNYGQMQPRTSQPAAKPQGQGNPSTTKPVNGKSSSGIKPAGVKPATAPQTQKPVVRSRESVIPSSPRSTRGL